MHPKYIDQIHPITTTVRSSWRMPARIIVQLTVPESPLIMVPIPGKKMLMTSRMHAHPGVTTVSSSVQHMLAIKLIIRDKI